MLRRWRAAAGRAWLHRVLVAEMREASGRALLSRVLLGWAVACRVLCAVRAAIWSLGWRRRRVMAIRCISGWATVAARQALQASILGANSRLSTPRGSTVHCFLQGGSRPAVLVRQCGNQQATARLVLRCWALHALHRRGRRRSAMRAIAACSRRRAASALRVWWLQGRRGRLCAAGLAGNWAAAAGKAAVVGCGMSDFSWAGRRRAWSKWFSAAMVAGV